MKSICGVKCESCNFKCDCKGCENTCGKPFGGDCIAAEYIKVSSKAEYNEFKNTLLSEINEMLEREGVPKAASLFELVGSFVNLSYTLPNGESVKFLDDKKIYLGCQVEIPGSDMCFGVVADTTFILISKYSSGGSESELVLFKQR